MSRNFELWQRASEAPAPAPLLVPPTIVPSDLGLRSQPIRTNSSDVEAECSEWLRGYTILRKHWRSSILFAVFIAASVAVVTMLMTPVYEPKAVLEVDPPGSEAVALQGRGDSGVGDYVQTQAQNLQSDGLAMAVIHSLHLDENPDFIGKVKPGVATPNQASDSAIRLTPAEDKALTAFKSSRKITNDQGSRFITVSVTAHNPVLAAQITNTLVKDFIEADLKARDEIITQWQRQLDDIKQRMDDSNRALSNFQNAGEFTTIGDNQNTFSQRVLELNQQLTQAQADRIQLQAYLDKLNSSSQSGSLPQISSDPVVQQLTAKLAEVKAELAQTLAVYGVNHPNSKKLQDEVDELQSQLNMQRSAIFNNLRTSYTASKAREGLLQLQMKGAKKQMTVLAQYNALKREADANTQLYTVLYQKIKEVAIAAETKSSSIRIVDQARVLNRPTKPQPILYMGGGLLGGLICGLLLAFLLESLDTRIRTPEDIKSCLGAGSVSVMPVIDKGARFALTSGGRSLARRTGRNPTPFLLERPNSPEAEALRGIYTAVRLSWRNNGSARVLMITSALQGEGKTMLSVNLALALAQQGSTCIVDADLRKPGVAPVLGVVGKYGLGDVLAGNIELDGALVPHVYVPGLSVLQAGMVSGDPGSLIASNAMPELVMKLKQRFEYVVIDSPPILPVADARVLSALVDGILMIGRSGVTPRAHMKTAVDMLREVRSAPVLGFVLNAAKYPAVDYAYYHGYGYGKEPSAAG